MESICDRDIHIFHISCQLQPCEVIFDETQKNYLKLTDRSRPVWTWKLLRLIDLYSISPVNSKLLKFEFINCHVRTWSTYRYKHSPVRFQLQLVLFCSDVGCHFISLLSRESKTHWETLICLGPSLLYILGLCTLLLPVQISTILITSSLLMMSCYSCCDSVRKRLVVCPRKVQDDHNCSWSLLESCRKLKFPVG